MTLIDAEPTLLRIKTQKHFVRKGENVYEFTDTGKLRFVVSILTPSYAEEGLLWPAQDQTLQLSPELAEQLREALRQPTDESRSTAGPAQRNAWEAVFELVKSHNPQAFCAQGSGIDIVLNEIRRLYKGEGK